MSQYLLNFENRKKLAKVENFKRLVPIWQEGKYNTDIKVGSINYLLKLAHEQITQKTEKPIISRSEWCKFYNESGKRREEILIKEPSSYATDVYYGRTLNELFEISKKFDSDLKEKGINLKIGIVFNFVYIMVVDFGYIEYKRHMLTLKNFCSKNENTSFSYSDPLSSFNGGIDAFISDKETNKVILAMQILPESRARKCERNDKLDSLNIEKLKNFNTIFGIPIKILYASTNGYIKKQKDLFNN